MSEIAERHHLTGHVILAAFVAAIGGLLFGFDTGVISGAVLFIRHDFALSDVMVEVTTSAVLVGAIVGAVAGGTIADAIGRRRTIIVAALVFLLATIVCVVPEAIWVLLVGRALIGVGIGTASFVVPLYISEMAPRETRGALVSLNQLAITAGILIAYGVAYAFAEHGDWRAMFAVGLVPSAGLLLGILPMPESPRWLLAHGREDQAISVLEKIRGSHSVADEAASIAESVKAERGGKLADLLSPELRTSLFVGVGLGIFQQITGINTVIYYAPTILLMAGIKSAPAAIAATAGVGAVNFLMTLVAIWLVDRRGRRPLLLWSLGGMVIALLVLAAAFAILHGRASGEGALGWLTAGGLMFYVAAFAVGLGPVFWLLIAEIYPLKVRGKAMSLATLANWGANFVVTLTFLSLTHVLGRSGAFVLYAVFGALAWWFSYRLVPETKGRTLEEIESSWLSRPGNRASRARPRYDGGSRTPS